MKKRFSLAGRERVIVVGVIVLAVVWAFVGVIAVAALAGGIGGIVVGANMPEKYRRRFIVGGKKARPTPAAPGPERGIDPH